MTRKLFAVATALLAATGLVVTSASAGPGMAGRGDGSLKVMSRSSLPFAADQATSRPVKQHQILPVAVPESVPREGKVESNLAAQLGANSSEQTFDVLVTTSVDPTAMKVDLQSIRPTHTYRQAMYGFAAKLTREQINHLATLPNVESIGADQVVHATIDHATRWTGISKAADDFGLTGDGDGFEQSYSASDTVIAIIDTGIDTKHKDLKGKVIGWKDMIEGKTEPYDDNGHGTHVSGIAAGAGVANRTMKGVAPGAALVGVKVLDADGSGTFAGVIAGIDWVVANKDKYNIRVLNMSLGSSGSSDGQDALSRAVNGAVESGIVAVVAAGNAGSDNYTVGSPGAAERAISVCAMRDVGEGGWSLANFSSRGPTADGRIKPDICAPGLRISAPKAGTTDRYVAYSGTSMATPMVAGVAALLVEANPYLTVEEIQDVLYSTAQDWGVPGKDFDFGYGRLDAYRAIQSILYLSGSGPMSPTHAVGTGIMANGTEVWYSINVTDAQIPVAATLVMNDTLDGYYDFDLYMFDAKGTELGVAMEIGRQETIHFKPVKPGKYYFKVQGYEGSGSYTLDVSWR